jgi:CRISPR-associated protein Cmr3
MRTWRFEAMDTWFFRESRPHGTVGGSELASLFPPPARTLAGAVRTAIGDSTSVNWSNYANHGAPEIRAAIGVGDDMGRLKLRGPFLCRNGQRIYPWPLNVLQRLRQSDSTPEFARLHVGSALHTHLGCVRVPALAAGLAGFTVPQSTWMARAGLESVLAGAKPEEDHIVPKKDLYVDELRLGIALKRKERTVEEGLLYETRHIRPRADVSVELDIDGVDAMSDAMSSGDRLLRMGGEGRAGGLSIREPGVGLPAAPMPVESDRGVVLLLLTPAALIGRSWLPGNFAEEVRDGVSTWVGNIKGIELRIHAAVIGKCHREGGWDMVEKKPRAVQSLVPAGSLWYCRVENAALADAYCLHGAQIGDDTALGRGLIAVGRWPAHEFNE